MAHTYLAPYIGAGTDDDPFRPRGSEQPGWSAIDLRPDSTILSGRALMAVPVRDDTIGTYLGDAPDEVTVAIKTAIQSRLGITLEATRLRQIIPELLITHAREDGTRWRPLRAMLDGMFRVYLDGLWWQAKSLAGGSTITESFNTADSGTLGPNLTWTEITAGLDVVSNQARLVGAGGLVGLARAETDLATDDHYAQAVLPSLDIQTASNGAGVICRKDSTATVTFYHYRASVNSGTPLNVHQLYKAFGGTFTQLGSNDETDYAAGETVYVEANGSAVTGKRNGTVSIGPITDTAITGNLRAGIRAFRSSGNSDLGGVTLDSFEAGDLAAVAAEGAHGAMYPRMQRHIHQSWVVPRVG